MTLEMPGMGVGVVREYVVNTPNDVMQNGLLNKLIILNGTLKNWPLQKFSTWCLKSGSFDSVH